MLRKTTPTTRRHGTDRDWNDRRDRGFRPPDDLGFGFGVKSVLVILDESKIGNKMFQLMDDIIINLRNLRNSNKKHPKMITLHSKL